LLVAVEVVFILLLAVALADMEEVDLDQLVNQLLLKME
jgi:hypothetical protein